VSRQMYETEIEFRLDMYDAKEAQPECRGLVVYSFGGTVEKSITRARKVFSLDKEWEVIRVEVSG